MRRVLESLDREYLWRIIERFGTKVPNRRDREPMIRAILKDPTVEVREVLSWLKISELRQLNEDFRLEARGREKEGYIACIAEYVQASAPTEEDGEDDEEIEDEVVVTTKPEPASSQAVVARRSDFDVFIVHGHNGEMRVSIKSFIESLGLKAVVLQDAPDRGLTILEKLEGEINRAKFAIVLLSPDDEGYSGKDGAAKAKKRARQNVILELGWAIGKLGRARVAVLHFGDVELPTDISGLVYIHYNPDHPDDANMKLARRLKQAGFSIDLNRIVEADDRR